MAAKRGFYRVDPGVWSDGDPETGEGAVTPAQYDSVILHETSSYSYLLSGLNPNERLEDELGAEKIADTWGELHGTLRSSTRDSVFEKVRERVPEGAEEKIRERVKKADVVDGEEVVEVPLIPVTFGARETEVEQKRLAEDLKG